MFLSFCMWEVTNEWMWSLRQWSILYSMYDFHGAGAQPCQSCCLWQKCCRCDSECSITNIKLVCCIKLESYLPYCEALCQSALKIMHCITELMKCLKGGYDDPLKERALSDNLSNFEKKIFKYAFFFFFFKCCWCLLLQCLRVREHCCLFSVPEPFLAARGCAAVGRCILYPNMRLSLALLWSLGRPDLGCSSLCWGFCRLQPSSALHPKVPIALWHVLAVLPALQLSPLADAVSSWCLNPCLMSVQAVWM